MDIFKLFFDHDLPLDKTVERKGGEKDESLNASIQDFLSPTPTFSKFYLTGTDLVKNKFGLNCLSKYSSLVNKLSTAFADKTIYSARSNFDSVNDAIENISVGEFILLTDEKEVSTDANRLIVNVNLGAGNFRDQFNEPLLTGHIIIYKEQAKNGFDLHIFSKENIYERLFYSLKKLVDDSFRFFSINSKRMRSERHFYFETWTLDRPPHGAEEVFKSTEL